MLRALLGLQPSRRYVFVVGCGHTGTTLTAALLGSHSRIYAIPYETSAFRKSRSTGEARRKLDAAAAGCDKPEAQYVCEKTPRHVFYVDQIKRAYPKSRFVVCLRNPLDTVASLKQRKGSIDGAINRWRDENIAASHHISRGECFEMRYETLISAPEDTVASLCRFLDLDYETTMFDFWKDERDWQGVKERRETDGQQGDGHRKLRNWQVHQPLMKNRIGRYREILTEDEISEIKHELGEIAFSLGYDFNLVS